VGSKTILSLSKQYGSLLAACKEKKVVFTEQAQKDYELVLKNGVTLIPYFSTNYPQSLFDLPDFPLLLYLKGELSQREGIAIVGTRGSSLYGNEQAYFIAKKLASEGYCIVSGLARGIDQKAHEGALECGESMAVIGSGLLSIYPPENRGLAERMTAVISEYPMMQPPLKGNFPKRNRIVSALTKKIILIEAPIKSGAMITMRLSREMGRFCYALPGRVDMPGFAGNLELLQKNQAMMVRNAEDLLGYPIKKQKSTITLSSDEQMILDHLPGIECSIEELLAKIDLPVSKINFTLMGLVLKRVVKEYPGKVYKLCER
jgi:DNA processing protein